MRYLKGTAIIFGITMAGDFLSRLLSLPVPAGVYGLFLLLFLLCAGWVRETDVAEVGDFFLEIMPLLFVPAGVGLIESLEQMRQVLIPFAAINGCSTLFVMAVTGLVAQAIIRRRGADGPVKESSDREERR